MPRTPLLVLLASLGLGCLRAPPPPAPRDAGSDAGPPAPLTVEGVEVLDRTGRPWPSTAIPASPLFALSLSEATAELPVFLLRDAPDAALEADLAGKPLRESHLARALPCAARLEGSSLIVTPLDRLTRGAELTLAVGAWPLEVGGPSLAAPVLVHLVVSTSPEGGARVLDAWPPDGFAAVPPSIDALAVRFDAPVTLSEGAVTLSTERGPVEGHAGLAPCARFGWTDGHCVALSPARALDAGTEHALTVDGVSDATGALVPRWEARFHTATREDLEPPTTLALTCALDERALPEVGCALETDTHIVLTAQVTEPVRATLGLGPLAQTALAPRGALRFELAELPPGELLEGRLTLTDLAGLSQDLPLLLGTAPPLASLSIVEVRADPLGREPAQEYVEVLNSGAVTVDLAGVALSDRPDAIGDLIALPFALAAGQRALLVADDFDPEDPSDGVIVPPGAPLVRVGRSLASGGLSNAGEPLFLRAPTGHRLSAVPALPTGAGACLVRVDEARLRTDALDAFVVAPCTPGRRP